ncbi:spinster family MFS transporter [Occallatibacter riparius]|uniref:MFS transporter n=1 Tax=Occallatibacter riparius TaxID=1002689 RepID=A0A9J7BGI4_9BACT|nr:MFS transporter [Occallatibacter riparius]UWZ81896.1 MFS transporter [Occallatibacter riparius]
MATLTQPVQRSRFSPALVTLSLLIGLNLLNYIDRYILPGAQSLIQKEFGWKDEQIGLLTTAMFVVYMLFAPLTGWLGDHFSRKPLIVGGAILWSLLTLWTAWVHDYTSMFVRHALVGVGEASFGIFAPAVLSDFYDERSRNRILSIFYLAIPVGAAIGVTSGGVLGSKYGWRTPFLVCAIPGFLIAVLYGFFGKEPKRGSSDHVKATADRATFRGLFRNPAFLTATFGLAMLTFAMGGISTWIAQFLERFTGMSTAAAGTWVGVVTVIDGIAGTAVGGFIAQRWLKTNHKALYLLSFWSVVLTIPCGALVFFGPRSWALPSLFAAEFFLFLNTGPLNTAIVNSVSAPVRATAISVNLFCIHFFGDTFSPGIIGAVSDRTNLRLALGVTLVSLLVSAVILGSGARFAPRLQESRT